MKIDIELRKGDIVKIKTILFLTINPNWRIMIDHNTRLRLIEKIGIDTAWWVAPIKNPELQVRISEDCICWVERHP